MARLWQSDNLSIAPAGSFPLIGHGPAAPVSSLKLHTPTQNRIDKMEAQSSNTAASRSITSL